MFTLSYDTWRVQQGAELAKAGTVDTCVRCHGIGEGAGTPCPSCAGVGYLTVDPQTGEPWPYPKLTRKHYAHAVIQDTIMWCNWTGGSVKKALTGMCGGDCPLSDSEIQASIEEWYMRTDSYV